MAENALEKKLEWVLIKGAMFVLPALVGLILYIGVETNGEQYLAGIESNLAANDRYNDEQRAQMLGVFSFALRAIKVFGGVLFLLPVVWGPLHTMIRRVRARRQA